MSRRDKEDWRSGGQRKYTDLESLAAASAVAVWLNGLVDGEGRRGALYTLARYLRWRKGKGLESNPDRIIEECNNSTVRTLAEHVKVLLAYFQETSGMSKKTTLQRYYKAVRSFYAANLIELPKARLRVQGISEERTSVDVRITASDYLNYVDAVLSAGHLSTRDRAIILVMLQSGMDASTCADVFNVVAFPQLVRHFGSEDFRSWDTSSCPVRIDLVRPKSEYRFYTFVDVDGVEALKAWLVRRRAKFGALGIKGSLPDRLPESDPIFVRFDGSAITSRLVTHVFHEAGVRAFVNKRESAVPEGAQTRYPFHSHEVRDTLITLHKRTGADVAAANFFAGHNVDKLGYDKSPWDDPDYYRREYLKLRPFLNPISGKVMAAEASLKRDFESRLRTLEDEIRSYRLRATPS